MEFERMYRRGWGGNYERMLVKGWGMRLAHWYFGRVRPKLRRLGL
jgi:hypothetical protein